MNYFVYHNADKKKKRLSSNLLFSITSLIENKRELKGHDVQNLKTKLFKDKWKLLVTQFKTKLHCSGSLIYIPSGLQNNKLKLNSFDHRIDQNTKTWQIMILL